MMTARLVAESWHAYKTNQEESSREALLEEYVPLVKRAVGRVRGLLPPSVEEGDLISYGVIGLLEAMDRFDETRGVPFEAYATMRIRGAIVDGMRAMGWLPRGAYQRAKQLRAAIDSLEQRLGYAASESELAGEMGLDPEAYASLVMEAAPVTLLPMEELTQLMDQSHDNALVLERHRRALVETLAGAIERLPERERLVVSLYFYEQLTLKEIAQVMTITEGRVCQLKTQALLRLRSALQRLKERDDADGEPS